LPYHPAGVVEAFARTSEDRKPGPGMASSGDRLNLDLTASWVVATGSETSPCESSRGIGGVLGN